MTRYCIQCGEPLGPYDRYCLCCGTEARNPVLRETEEEPEEIQQEPDQEPSVEPEEPSVQGTPQAYTAPEPLSGYEPPIPGPEPPKQRKRWPVILGCVLGVLIIALIVVISLNSRSQQQAEADITPSPTIKQTEQLAPTLNMTVVEDGAVAPTPTPNPTPANSETAVQTPEAAETPSVAPVSRDMGNTAGNTYWGGLSVAAQDGRIYALCNSDKGTPCIISMDGAGQDTRVLPDVRDALYLNDGADGYIYFQENQDGPAVKRVKADGSASPEVLISNAVMPLRVQEEIIYINTNGRNLCAFSTETGETRVISDTVAGDTYYYANGLLYYSDAAQGYAICAVESGGGSPSIIMASPGYNPAVAGDYLYFTDKPAGEAGATLYRMPLGGSDAEVLIQNISGGYLADKERIIYSAAGGLYIYDIADGTHALINTDRAMMLSQSGNYLFYCTQAKDANNKDIKVLDIASLI